MTAGFARRIGLAAALVIHLAAVAQAQIYTPSALKTVVQRAQSVSAQGRQPVVIFDLDDTLINTRERNLRILNDFVGQGEIQTQYPLEAAKIDSLSLSQVRYLMADTLAEIGVKNLDFLKSANDFWLSKFFSNEYCARDQQTLGAAKYLHDLVKAGAFIVYLTGRDIPRMHQGTIANLRRNFFPISNQHALLMMKPDAKVDDLDFKKQSFLQISELGEVIGVFENEPANINAMADQFPEATAIFVDTIHSPKPDVPEEKILWVQNFDEEN